MADVASSPWKTTAEAAAYSKRHEDTITTALRSGTLRGSQKMKKGKWLIHVDDLDAWISKDIVKPRRSSKPAA